MEVVHCLVHSLNTQFCNELAKNFIEISSDFWSGKSSSLKISKLLWSLSSITILCKLCYIFSSLPLFIEMIMMTKWRSISRRISSSLFHDLITPLRDCYSPVDAVIAVIFYTLLYNKMQHGVQWINFSFLLLPDTKFLPIVALLFRYDDEDWI